MPVAKLLLRTSPTCSVEATNPGASRVLCTYRPHAQPHSQSSNTSHQSLVQLVNYQHYIKEARRSARRALICAVNLVIRWRLHKVFAAFPAARCRYYPQKSPHGQRKAHNGSTPLAEFRNRTYAKGCGEM